MIEKVAVELLSLLRKVYGVRRYADYHSSTTGTNTTFLNTVRRGWAMT